jgi:hypothetical protein
LGIPQDPGSGRAAAVASIQKYGPASEKLSDAQLELLEVEPGVSNLGNNIVDIPRDSG